MQEYLAETWTKIAPELRAKMGEAAYEAWLVDLRPVAMERGVLHLEAPNRMVCERIDRLFRDIIRERVSAALGTQVEVSVQPRVESLPADLDVGPRQPVIDQSNRTAYLLLGSLLEGKDLPSRLFFFYGGLGVGKSFLLQWWRGLSKGRVLHLSGPQFSKAVQASSRDRRLAALREDLCQERVLILDELHRIAGQKRVQQELAAILEERSQLSAVTLMASRWHPRDIWRLEPGLASWLTAGFVTRLDQPGPGGRLRFLRALAGSASRNGRGTNIEDLARKVQGTYGELRRAWLMERNGAKASASSWTLIEPRSKFEQLLEKVSRSLGVPVGELTGKSQVRTVSHARKILCWLCVQEGLNRAEVGRFLGGRTRAAISHAIKVLERQIAGDPELHRLTQSLL